MLTAELRGKLPSVVRNLEDVLTSYVFSFLQYSTRAVFLRQFLDAVGVRPSDAELNAAEFRFWQLFDDGTEPDVVIVVGRYFLLFEAKLFAPFDPGCGHRRPQIEREIEAGLSEAENEGKTFRFIAVTGDSCSPRGSFRYPARYAPLVRWVNWQAVARLILGLTEKYGSDLPDPEYAADLLAMLDSRNLRGYRGFGVIEVGPVEEFSKPIFILAEQLAFRGGFLGFPQALEDLPIISPSPDRLLSERSTFRGLGAPSEPPERIFFERS